MKTNAFSKKPKSLIYMITDYVFDSKSVSMHFTSILVSTILLVDQIFALVFFSAVSCLTSSNFCVTMAEHGDIAVLKFAVLLKSFVKNTVTQFTVRLVSQS